MIEFKGLTSEQAEQGVRQYGLNTLPEEKHNPCVAFLRKFWSPVPWMLEVIIVLEIMLGKSSEAGVIGALILFNAALSSIQEGKAKNAVRLLRKRLEVQARVLRDGVWDLLPAQNLVPKDIIRIRMGDIVPADAKLLQGKVQIDQSAITGESLPVEPQVQQMVYAGSIVRHGEAYAEIISTGKNTFYGKTAEIMRSTKTPSHLERTILSIIQSLVTFDLVLIIGVFIYSFWQGISLDDLLPFSLLLLVASVPVALPATYALSTALGSMELAKAGVLVTRLSAIEEAAAMTMLCVDKTGTITQNSLTVSACHSYAPFTNDDLLCLAAAACEEASQDPIDLAILHAARTVNSPFSIAYRVHFFPFDSAKKYSEASVQYKGELLQVYKGAPAELVKMVADHLDLTADVEGLSSDGSRVLGVVVGDLVHLRFAGLIALQDPPRLTSKESIQTIQDLGVQVKMVTGDGLATARSIGSKVGIGPKAIQWEREGIQPEERAVQSDVIAGVFPEDKFQIIQMLQRESYICGMTGDGVNDAPALKKAEVGIAVSNATDVAKAAASLVLINPGLVDVVEAIKTSRRIYQRMLTYTLNKIIKTLEISVLLGLGLVLANDFIISQLLIVLLLFTNDFVTMSISTDKVGFSRDPDKWDIKRLTFVGGIFAALILGMSIFALYAGFSLFHLSILEIRTLVFLILVFTGQATVYLVRERNHFWHSLPSSLMLVASILDILLVSVMAVFGVLMAPISLSLVLGLLALVAIYFLLLDFLKMRIFKFFHI
jgi:H+-transporting ATPase